MVVKKLLESGLETSLLGLSLSHESTDENMLCVAQRLALSKLKTALKAKKIAVMKGQKAADYFTIVKDPDDEWGSKSQMNKGGLDECLKRSAFTEGTIIKNNSSGVFYLVVSDEVKTTRAKARRIQKLLELERIA